MQNQERYKNFKNIRAFHNAKIHALAYTIAGEEKDTLIQAEAEALGVADFQGVSALTDAHAKALYDKLAKAGKSMRETLSKTQPVSTTQIPGNNSMTTKQRKILIKLARYIFAWSQEYTFSMIIETCPELRSRLTGWELNNSRLGKLFSIISKKQADKVIKRLTKIEKKKLYLNKTKPNGQNKTNERTGDHINLVDGSR